MRFKEALKSYHANPEKKRDSSKTTYKENMQKRKQAFKANYCEHREEICRQK